MSDLMTRYNLGGVLLLGVGVVCLATAAQMSDSVLDQVKHLFTGEYRDKTMWLGLTGIVALMIGVGGLAAPWGRPG